jgi:hypothetical protein
VPAGRRLFAERFGAERLHGGGEVVSLARGVATSAATRDPADVDAESGPDVPSTDATPAAPRPVRLTLRLLGALAALVTFASALAVLVSDLTVPGYRAHYGDAVWFVALYAAVQLFIVIELARDGPLVAWVAVARAAAAWVFLALFVELWPAWRWWTPARYVYQLFEWGQGAKIGLFALVFLGRGAFNTFCAFYFTEPWWRPLRQRRPLLGRLVTAVPIFAVVFCVWAFLQLVREEARTFSREAQEVADLVFQGLDCAAVRAHAGQTTTDLRQRGDRHYHVRIAYGCALTRVVVRAEDGRLGTAAGPRLGCCEAERES